MKRQNLYEFFLPTRIGDRSKAIDAVVAGVISGSLLTLLTGVAGLVLFVQSGFQQGRTPILLVGALIFLSVTIGVWKHVFTAAVVGLCGAIAFTVWAIWSDEPVVAAILLVPLVGGFWTAARGIVVLRGPSAR